MKRLRQFWLATRRVFHSASAGVKGAASVWPALLALLVTTLVLAAIATSPALVSLDRALAGYPWAGQMLRGFDWTFWSEWSLHEPDVPGMITLAVAMAALVALLQQTVFSGALLETLEQADRPRFSRFLERGFRMAPRMAGLLLGSLVLFLLAAKLWGWSVEWAFHRWISPRLESGGAQAGWALGRGIGFAVLFYLVRLGADYGRVRLIAEDRRNPVVALLQGFRFLGQHFTGAVSVAGIVAILESVLLAGLAWLDMLVPPGSWGTIALAFVLAQLFLFLRIAGRAASLASAHAYYRSVSDEWTAERDLPEAIPIPAPIPEPYENAPWA